MKKAGFIIGIMFFIIAILLCVFGLKMINKEKVSEVPNTEVVDTTQQGQQTQQPQVQPNVEGNQQGQQSQQSQQSQQPTQQPNQQTQQQQPTQQQGTTTVVEKVITKEVSGVMTIDENSLGEPIATKDVIVRIINKRVMMIDEDTDSKNPKMLTYCFDVLTPDNMQLTLFVTHSVYTLYNVADMLQVSYQIYTNDNGIQFPLVLNVTTVQ